MTSLTLSVFHEFAATDAQLAAITAIPNLTLDRAAAPNAMAKSDTELDVVKSNAKLFFDPNAVADSDVDAILAQLSDASCGLEVTHRQPVTSAGHKMKGRVILKLKSS